MALSPRTQLGPYETLSPLGAGGMGEVYRARDTKLNRDVALKILPDAFASDPDRMARFTREAQTLAALNHPNIAAIYGIEESKDVRALVMELVEGETLAERLKAGPVSVAEAVRVARQVADALQAAHEKGIIHRDLKPANIAFTAGGVVKVLDFGLAKVVDPSPATELSNSPTLSLAATQAGVILGTAAYMAPEQAKGRAADKRADIWAFGCVLFEMLTGTRAFDGEDISDTLANVLKMPPDWTRLPSGMPASLATLLTGCLEKDRARRMADIAVAQFLLSDNAATLSAVSAPVVRRAPAWRRALPWGVAGALGVGLALVLVWWAPWRSAVVPRVTRTTITTSGPVALTINGTDRDVAITPDGSRIVYVGNGGTQLFVRALDALEPVAIATSASLRMPFVSPDGQWIGFFNSADFTLRKVSIAGGPPITLARLDSGNRGAAWALDNTIVLATSSPSTGLQRVPAGGGTPEVLTRPDRAQGEFDHFWPEVLPGGRAVLFTITAQAGGIDAAQVAVRDLRTGAQKVLVRGGSHAHYVASGHLVYVAAGTLRAISFDLNRLETRGTAVPVVPRLATMPFGGGDFAVAADGTLVYVDVPGRLAADARTLVWVDRTGKEEPLAAPPRAYQHPRLSPDGTRVALFSNDEENDLWIWDLRRATLARLTANPSQDWFPVWTPDSRRIIFTSGRAGPHNLWWQAADGTGAAERLTTSEINGQFVTGITPDGTAAVFNEATPTMGRDLLQVALDGTRRVTPLLRTPFSELNGTISPDGHWLAYEADNSGRREIYVRPFPNVSSGQWEVSSGGGVQPLWARNGKELFYFAPDGTLQRAPVEASGTTWKAATPTKVLEARYFTGASTSGVSYDVSADGQRFLVIKAPGGGDSIASSPSLIVVQHFDEELKRLVPTK